MLAFVPPFSGYSGTNHTEFDISGPVFSPEDWPRLSSLGPLELRRLVDLRLSQPEGGLRALVRKTLGRRCLRGPSTGWEKLGKTREKPMDLEPMGQFFSDFEGI